MRRPLIALALLVAGACAHAQSFVPSGGSLACSANPTADGCVIFNGGSVNTATFFDLNGRTFQFRSDNTLYINGVAFSASPNKVQMGSGHQAFIGNTCQTSTLLQLWQNGSNSSGQWIDPSTSYTPRFAIGPLTYADLNTLTHDTPTNYTDGITVTISALPTGLPLFATSGVLSKKNQTWNVDDSAIFGCSVAEGAAIITTDNLTNLTQGNTLNLGKSEWEWVHGGGVRAFHLCGATTLNGTAAPSRPNVNDTDFGVDSCNGPAFTASISGSVMTVTAITQGTLSLNTLIHGAGVANATTIASFGTGTGGTGTYNLNNSQTIASEQMGGTDGGITLNNVWTEHNGASTATTGSNGATHNAYIGSDCETLIIAGGGYYAESPQGDTAHAGYQLKSRCASGGTITGATFAGVSRFLGNTDQMASAAMDFPCGGGPLSIGTSNLGNVIELGQGDNQGGGHGLIKYGDGRSGDCSTNWFNNVISITNNWIIIDLAVTAQSVYCAGGAACDNPGGFATATATNNRVICNSTIVTCTFAALFPNATDGGGNVFYATRAAARAANPGISGLGDCTGVTIATCPLPLPLGSDKFAVALAGTCSGCWVDLGTQPGVTAPQMASVVPSPLPSGNAGQIAVTNNWSTGTLDTKNSVLYAWGGGHADYCGNEVYRFTLSTLNWDRPFGPSTCDTNNTGIYADGNPSSRHTYSAIAYVPAQNGWYAMGGSIYQSGGGVVQMWFYSTTNGTWTRKTDFPHRGPDNYGEDLAYNSADGNLYAMQGFSGIDKYVPGTDTWTWSNQDSDPVGYYTTAEYDPVHNVFIVVGNGAVYTVDLTGHISNKTTSGDASCQNVQAPGLAYYTPASEMVCHVPGDARLWLLNTTTFAWTIHSAAAGNTVTPANMVNASPGGEAGRFRYDSNHTAFVTAPQTNTDVFAFKPDF